MSTDVIFDIRILRNIGHGENRLCQRKLEVATRSSYTWVKPMFELWRFVYITSHVTLQAKLDAQKVNYQADFSEWNDPIHLDGIKLPKKYAVHKIPRFKSMGQGCRAPLLSILGSLNKQAMFLSNRHQPELSTFLI